MCVTGPPHLTCPQSAPCTVLTATTPAGPSRTLAAYAHRLATGREPALTGSVVGVLYAVGRLAGIVSLLTLAYTAVIAAFAGPKVWREEEQPPLWVKGWWASCWPGAGRGTGGGPGGSRLGASSSACLLLWPPPRVTLGQLRVAQGVKRWKGGAARADALRLLARPPA